MRRWILAGLALVCLAAWGGVAVLLLLPANQADGVLPTRHVWPTESPTDRPSRTPTATVTPSATLTMTLTASFTPTSTATATATLEAPLAVRVLTIQWVMPGVPVAPTATPFPPGTVLLPAPPLPLEPLPDATLQAPPYTGWMSFESDHPGVIYATPWERRQVREASQGQYHRTDDTRTSVSFQFEGEGLRLRYVAARNMGLFEILVDGQVIDTVDAYASDLNFPGTTVYMLGRGSHLLVIRPTGRKHPSSEGSAVGLDAIQVFRADAHTLILSPQTPTHTPEVLPVEVERVSAPATPVPLATPLPLRPVQVRLVIAWDENLNRAVDPAEGVAGLPVRLVLVGSNQVIATAFTDERGFAQIEAVPEGDVRLVVPYLGKVWEVRRGGNGPVSFSLLLPPVNLPGLIP